MANTFCFWLLPKKIFEFLLTYHQNAIMIGNVWALWGEEPTAGKLPYGKPPTGTWKNRGRRSCPSASIIHTKVIHIFH